MGRGGCKAPSVTMTASSLISHRAIGNGDVKQRVVTVKELSEHATAEDCWIVISGKVYNLTTWLERHPGGLLPILNVAGQDATDAFLSFHPAKTRLLLPKFYVGELEEVELPAINVEHRQMIQDLEDAGLFETNMWSYYRLSACLAVVLAGVVSCVLFSSNFTVHMIAAAVLGCFWNQCNFIGHDTGHNGITKNRRLDSLIGLFAGNMMTGISIGWWKRTHNVHHVSPNSLTHDSDIQHLPIMAVSTDLFSSLYSQYHGRSMPFDAAARFLVSHQHYVFYPLMAVARLNLYFQSFLLVFTSPKLQNRYKEVAALAFFWTWHCALLYSLPGWGTRVPFFFLSHAMCGILHVQICCSHWPMPTFEGRPNNNEWVRTQLRGTLDWQCTPWMDWWYGGLQYQIEHHLFPRAPRHNLRKIMNRVRPFCKKHNVPYMSVSFIEANKMIYRTLYAAAMAARDVSKPPTKFTDSILWEGVNAIG